MDKREDRRRTSPPHRSTDEGAETVTKTEKKIVEEFKAGESVENIAWRRMCSGQTIDRIEGKIEERIGDTDNLYP